MEIYATTANRPTPKTETTAGNKEAKTTRNFFIKMLCKIKNSAKKLFPTKERNTSKDVETNSELKKEVKREVLIKGDHSLFENVYKQHGILIDELKKNFQPNSENNTTSAVEKTEVIDKPITLETEPRR